MSDDNATMIEDCENRDSKLTDWERIFINSIACQLVRSGSLTLKQEEQLEQIWDRVTG